MRQVIALRYGLDGSPPATYRQIGTRLGFSHEFLYWTLFSKPTLG
jgi:DNA-directed RNA polymerase sigma subunit (sigma70/sigma32)